MRVDLGSIPGLGRSPGEGKGYPLWYSGLENSMDCIVHRVAKSQTRLSDFHFHCNVYLAYSPWVSQAYNTWDVYSQIVAKEKKRKEYVFNIYFCLCWVFVAAQAFL